MSSEAKMLTRGCFCWLVGIEAAALLAWARPARADDVANECAAAHERTQQDKLQGRYLSALENAKVCTRSVCSPILVNECVRMYDEIGRDLPSFVFSARDTEGNELTDVRVLVDGEPLLERLDGSPRPFDPGLHVFRFEKAGLPPAEVRHTARVGDRNRLIEVILGEKKAPTAIDPLATSAEIVPAEPSGIPIASYVLAGVGVVGLGGFAYLRLSATSDYESMEKSCSPRCEENEVDDVRLKFKLSYVALGVGSAAMLGAVTVYFIGKSGHEKPRTEVSIAPVMGGGAARFVARF